MRHLQVQIFTAGRMQVALGCFRWVGYALLLCKGLDVPKQAIL